ncbi:hypothetical protein RchiOBHm_Chr7g0219881 [Rosa chinensis]|uniref:Uncharacterized protein n=1 Tax=Rosa chinensis TaxID=74649 RepID=A0A2P6PCM7_ROSCH|nr:hypothetical protein RchiOBHm_Chr7g0219881 [Rosa chinensis]
MHLGMLVALVNSSFRGQKWPETSQISCVPDHQTNLRISARNPPRYHSSLDQSFVKCTIEQIMNIPTPKALVKRLYFIDNSSINQLQSQA